MKKPYIFNLLCNRLNECDNFKIKCFEDGRLELNGGTHHIHEDRKETALIVYKSQDEGKIWSEPIEYNCQGAVQDDFLINKHNPIERIVGMFLRHK